MSNIWKYFTLTADRIAICKIPTCNYKKNYPPQTATTLLKRHLKTFHKDMFMQLQKEDEEKATEKAKPIQNQQTMKQFVSGGVKRPFSASSCSVLSDEQMFSDEENEVQSTSTALTSFVKSPWSADGEKTVEIDKIILEMLAVDLQPFKMVEDVGFNRLLNSLQPKYRPKKRNYFASSLLPTIYNDVKARVKSDLAAVDFISLTTDCWSSRNSTHSLLSITAHFVQDSEQKFLVLAAKTIKGSHKAENLVELIRKVLTDFDIAATKIFLIVRDAAEVMVKTCSELQLPSMDCFAHKINLAISDGLKKLSKIEELENILERVKKFIRKLRKSPIQREEFQQIQKNLELPANVLIKDMEVRWSSTFNMLLRFQQNRRAIMRFSAEDATEKMPSFSDDDWNSIQDVIETLKPIAEATTLLQNRDTTISSIIPIYRAIKHMMAIDDKILSSVKNSIISGLEERLAEKVDRRGVLKRVAWADNQNLVLSTFIDPRFKFAPYLDSDRQFEYTSWLINELEKLADIQEELATSDIILQPNQNNDIFAKFEEANASEAIFETSSVSPIKLTNRQKAEVEVNEYLRSPKLHRSGNVFAYWSGENAAKWPLLTKLSRRLFSAPASSAESERLFSTAGLIITDLRKRLLSENVEKLLFLHHNLKHYNFKY